MCSRMRGWKMLNEEIGRYQIVSFDIFDTLIHRILYSSADVFEITREFYFKRYGENLKDFTHNRIKLERSLWGKTEIGEFTLNNIYKKMEMFYSNKKCERLKSIELEVEMIVARRNKEVTKLYDKVKNKILVSDMYLEKKHLEKILRQLGIVDYNALYISGEQGAAKYNGKLFKLVGNKIGTEKKIIHLGDSFRGDYIMPRLLGWSSCWIKKYRNPYLKIPKKYSMADSLLIGLVNNRFLYNENYYTNIGYVILGPLLYCYVKWIEQQVRVNDIEKVVFLSRDGWCIKKVFDNLYREKYKTEYMYVSRKSAVNATSDTEINISSLLRKYKFRNKETLESVLLKLGIKNTYGIQKLELSRNKLYKGTYNRLIEPYFKEIHLNNVTQKKFMMEYTKSLFNRRKIAIVDVGWHGTIQDCIEQICGDTVHVYGLYLGLEGKNTKNKTAFLSDKIFDANMIPFIRGIVETFFSAPHPSTDRYIKNDNRIIPSLGTDTDNSSYTIIQHIHDGAMEFIKEFDYYAQRLCLSKDIDIENIQRAFIEFCLNPSKLDLSFMQNLTFNDVTDKKLLDYQPGNISKNMTAFLQSDWKAAYAKILFKFPLPYGRFFVRLNKLRKMVVKPK